jgi:Uma2 family endonuclease
MSESTANPRRRYTWADYQAWPDDERWEIIGGEAYLMSPSPTSRHQLILRELCRQLANHFKGKTCHLLVSPMDVVLSDEDIVQPDLLVVCNPSQIKRTHIEGAPTLVAEILSDSSTSRDRLLKLNLYARAGVKEYWIVTPWPSLVEVLLLEGTRYVVHKVFGKDDTLTSPTFPDMSVTLKDVFDFPLEPGEEPPVAKEPPAPKYQTATR